MCACLLGWLSVKMGWAKSITLGQGTMLVKQSQFFHEAENKGS